MDRTDFSQSGVYQFDADDFQFLQDSWEQASGALQFMLNDPASQMAILQGGVITSSGTIDVSEGWAYYKGEIIKIKDATGLATGGSYGWVLEEAAAPSISPHTFKDGTQVNVFFNRTIQFQDVSTPPSNFIAHGQELDFRTSDWANPTAGTNISASNFYYRKRWGRLETKGYLETTGSLSGAGNTGSGAIVCTLGDGFKPSTEQRLIGMFVRSGASTYGLDCWMETGGSMRVRLLGHAGADFNTGSKIYAEIGYELHKPTLV